MALGFAALLWVAEQFVPEPPTEPALRQSRALTVSFLGYTNGDAIIQVTNQSAQILHLFKGWVIYSRYHGYEAKGRFSGGCGISGSPLLPRTAIKVRFPAPTNQLYWRAEVRSYEDRRARMLQWIGRRLYRRLTVDNRILGLRLAGTDWIAPPDSAPSNQHLQATP